MVAPELLFSGLFSPDMAGLYLLGHKVVATPMGTITMSISNVFFGGARHHLDAGTFAQQVRTIHNRLSRLSVPLLVVLALYAPLLFEWLFGGRWAEAGRYTQCLTVMLYFQFISAPLIQIFSILEKPKGTMLSNLTVFVLRVVAIYVGFSMGSRMGAVLLFSVFSAIGYFVFACATTMLAGVRFRQILLDHLFAAGLALGIAAPCYLIQAWSGMQFPGLIAAIVLASACYAYMGVTMLREKTETS